jgi:hypothetical protein
MPGGEVQDTDQRYKGAPTLAVFAVKCSDGMDLYELYDSPMLCVQ